MKHIYLFIMMGLISVMSPAISLAIAQEQAPSVFFDALYDIPVMSGLEELPELSTNFDKADGRISQAGALAKDVTQEQVLAFYAASLVQMGWKKVQSNQYDREGEQLSITFEEAPESLGGVILVKFMLQPSNK